MIGDKEKNPSPWQDSNQWPSAHWLVYMASCPTDNFFFSNQTNLSAMQEDLLATLESKNPSVKEETVRFLTRCFCKSTPAALPKTFLKPICSSLLKVRCYTAVNERKPHHSQVVFIWVWFIHLKFEFGSNGFNPQSPNSRSAWNFSFWCQCLSHQRRHDNLRYDHPRWILLKYSQLLPTTAIINVWGQEREIVFWC